MRISDIRQWLEAIADDAMSRAGEFSECGPLPLTAPDGVIRYGAQRVVEFYAVLPDGARLTTTRPLNRIQAIPVEPKVIRRRWRRPA